MQNRLIKIFSRVHTTHVSAHEWDTLSDAYIQIKKNNFNFFILP